MAHPDRLIRSQLRSSIVVTLLSEETFDGVLVEADDTHVILANAFALAPNGDRVPVEGRLWLPRLGIAYMQQTK
ncbi:hypothetical protein [Rathayibacter sp. Leaf248]|uniref:hypothetical protein n=1 Tax=Rathayibacter sp. Leaf248 TaxID=2876555 RepID=UPI001E5ED0C2|nr:hypothetical protein [Rathayibacter sp. Leaf248]